MFKRLIGNLLITTLAALIVAFIIPGVKLDSGWAAFQLAIVLGILNSVVKPLLTLLTIPLTILTLGLFLLVLDVIIIYLAKDIVDGFHVTNWLSALVFSFLLSITSSLVEKFIKSTQ